MNNPLTIDHCRKVLNTETVIHADNKIGKSFIYNAWKHEYFVWHNGECIANGWEIESLIDVYNKVN